VDFLPLRHVLSAHWWAAMCSPTSRRAAGGAAPQTRAGAMQRIPIRALSRVFHSGSSGRGHLAAARSGRFVGRRRGSPPSSVPALRTEVSARSTYSTSRRALDERPPADRRWPIWPHRTAAVAPSAPQTLAKHYRRAQSRNRHRQQGVIRRPVDMDESSCCCA